MNDYLTEIKVRGYHCDFYGHVNNARYLEFFEEDRWACLESRVDLLKWVEEGQTFLVVNININYRQAAEVGAILVISTKLEKVGNRSSLLKQQIIRKGTEEVVAEALVTFVVTDRSGRAMTMDGKLREQIEQLA